MLGHDRRGWILAFSVVLIAALALLFGLGDQVGEDASLDFREPASGEGTLAQAGPRPQLKRDEELQSESPASSRQQLTEAGERQWGADEWTTIRATVQSQEGVLISDARLWTWKWSNPRGYLEVVRQEWEPTSFQSNQEGRLQALAATFMLWAEKVRVTAPGYLPAVIDWGRETVDQGKLHKLHVTEGLIEFVLELRRAAEVRGTVSDTFGHPVTAARIVVHGSAPVAETLTDDRGRFFLPDLDPTLLYKLEVWLETTQFPWSLRVIQPPADVDFRVPLACALQVKVEGLEGVVRGRLEAKASDGQVLEVLFDAGYIAKLPPLPSGQRIELAVRAAGRGRYPLDPVDLVAGKQEVVRRASKLQGSAKESAAVK